MLSLLLYIYIFYCVKRPDMPRQSFPSIGSRAEQVVPEGIQQMRGIGYKVNTVVRCIHIDGLASDTK